MLHAYFNRVNKISWEWGVHELINNENVLDYQAIKNNTNMQYPSTPHKTSFLFSLLTFTKSPIPPGHLAWRAWGVIQANSNRIKLRIFEYILIFQVT